MEIGAADITMEDWPWEPEIESMFDPMGHAPDLTINMTDDGDPIDLDQHEGEVAISLGEDDPLEPAEIKPTIETQPLSVIEDMERDPGPAMVPKPGSQQLHHTVSDSEESSASEPSPPVPAADPPLPSKLFPIEVVLRPPDDPELYKRIPPSNTVERILDRVLVYGQDMFSVEYTDGRIDQVSCWLFCLKECTVRVEHFDSSETPYCILRSSSQRRSRRSELSVLVFKTWLASASTAQRFAFVACNTPHTQARFNLPSISPQGFQVFRLRPVTCCGPMHNQTNK